MVGPTHHRRVGVVGHEVDEEVLNRSHVLHEDVEAVADLHHDRRVHRVLTRRAPVDVLAGDVEVLLPRVDDGHRQQPLFGEVRRDGVGVDVVDRGSFGHLLGGRLGDETLRGFGAGQGGLEREKAVDVPLLVEYLP